MKFNAAEAPREGGQSFPKLFLDTNESARINLITTQGWEMTVRHWVDGIGHVHCLGIADAQTPLDLLRIEEEGGVPEKCVLCKEVEKKTPGVGLPLRRVGLRVLRYKTASDGTLTAGKLQYWMEIWIIDNWKYRQLLNIIEEWGGEKKEIFRHDLLLTCEDKKYQKISIAPKRDALWLRERDAVLSYFKEEAKKYDLFSCLGNSMSEEQLKRRLEVIRRRGGFPVSEAPSAGETPVETGESFFGEGTGLLESGETAHSNGTGEIFDFSKELGDVFKED